MNKEEAMIRLEEITSSYQPRKKTLTMKEGIEYSLEKWKLISQFPSLGVQFHGEFCGLCMATGTACRSDPPGNCPLGSCMGIDNLGPVANAYSDYIYNISGGYQKARKEIKIWRQKMKRRLKEYEQKEK